MKRELVSYGHRWVVSQHNNASYICVRHVETERYWYVRPCGTGFRVDTHTLPLPDLGSVLAHLSDVVGVEIAERARLREAIEALRDGDER